MNSEVKTYNVIAPFILHKRILTLKNSNINIKLFTKESFFELFLGSVDKLDVLNISKHENISYSESAIYAAYMPYIKDNPTHEKTKKIKHIKDNNPLRINFIAQKTFRKYETYIYGYNPEDDRNLYEVLNHFKLNSITKDYSFNLPKIPYYEYSDARIEIGEAFNRIASLIDDGVEEKDISIICSETYLVLFNLYAHLFNIKLNYNNPNLFQNIDSVKLYTECLEGKEIKDENYSNEYSPYIEAINALKEKGYSNDSIAEFIKKSLKSSKLDRGNSGIKVYTSINTANPNKYLFVVGFSDEILSSKKDNEYLSDIEKVDDTVLQASYEVTNNKKQFFKILLSETKSAIFSYSDKNSINDSKKIDNLSEYNVIEMGKDILSTKRYSLKFDRLILDLFKDDEGKYGLVSSLSQYLDKKIGSDYDTYEPNYKSDKNIVTDYQIKLSNTSSTLYNKCPLAYFFKYYLKVKDDSNSYAFDLGNIAHKGIEENVIIDDSNLEQFTNDYQFNYKELFYLKKMLKSNKEMRKNLSEFIANFKPDFIEEHEKKLESKIDDNTTLEGKFDLILASDKEYIVMDFKSSPKDYKEVLNYFGFDNQLQIYLYLFSQQNEELIPMGAVYAPLFSKSLKSKNGKEFIYSGYIVSKELLTDIVGENEFKKYFKGTKAQRDFNTLKKDQEHLVKLLKNTSSNIRKGIFKFTPIRCKDTKDLNSCKNCTYKDMCFYQSKDLIFVDLPDELKKSKKENLSEIDDGGND